MAMNDLSSDDLQLILQRMALGDAAAYSTLHLHYYGQIYCFARNFVRDEDSAYDVAQEVLIAQLRKPTSFQGKARFSSYLCEIAKNKAADLERIRSAQGTHVDIDDEKIRGLADESRSSNPELAFADRQTEESFRKCLDRLPVVQKEALAMSVSQGMTETEIAREVQCAIGTVKSRLSAARGSMRKCLGRWYRGNRND